MSIETTGSAPSGSAALAYSVAGTGTPLTFLHAGIADRRMWDLQIAPFAKRFRTLRYDLRGFGRTEMVDEAFSHGADLVSLLDHLNTPTSHLVACSMSGSVALQVAIAHPERVTSLVLVGSGAPGVVPEGGYYEPPQWPEAEQAIKAGNLDRAAQLEVEIWIGGYGRSVDEVPAGIRAAVMAMDRIALESEARRERFEEQLVPRAGTLLGEISCPTLVVVGERDLPDIQMLGRHLADNIARAQLVWLSDAAHLPNMERSDEFDRVVLEFLTGL